MAANALLKHWDTPFGMPPFGKLLDQDFKPALTAALAEARRNFESISESEDPSDFDNVIAKIESADELLIKVVLVFENLVLADSNAERREIERWLMPLLADFETEVAMNRKLFLRVAAVWQSKDQLNLSDEQRMALQRHYEKFVRSGAELEGKDRRRFREIQTRLAELTTIFSQNVQQDEASWFMELRPDDITGLPAFLIEASAQAAKERSKEGHIVTLDRSLIVPFLQFSSNRELRRCAYEAWHNRGARGDENDTRAIVKEILHLRREKARLLGFDSFADYKLANKMAKTPGKARELLEAIWPSARQHALKDIDFYTETLQLEHAGETLEPWDWQFFAERRRSAEHDLNEEDIKPYLQLDQMRAAAFDVAGRLFGLTFSSLECQLYHSDCKAWAVRKGDRAIAVFIADDFARPSKRSGAWSSVFRRQHRLFDEPVLPIVINVCNFMKGTDETPCLLSFEDARTLFHEFGHALHAMLSNAVYPSLSGTSVPLDFVELPSQLFENWLETTEVLERFAVHYETGEPIPDDMRNRLIAARNFDQGFQTVEYLSCAFVDLELHSSHPPSDPMRRQAEVLLEIGMPSAIRMRHETPHFLHLFAGDGYASGYYSYIWADTIVADAYKSFLESEGPFCKETAARLEKHILSAGGTHDPVELYRRFRGKLPGPEALLHKRGLLPIT